MIHWNCAEIKFEVLPCCYKVGLFLFWRNLRWHQIVHDSLCLLLSLSLHLFPFFLLPPLPIGNSKLLATCSLHWCSEPGGKHGQAWGYCGRVDRWHKQDPGHRTLSWKLSRSVLSGLCGLLVNFPLGCWSVVSENGFEHELPSGWYIPMI